MRMVQHAPQNRRGAAAATRTRLLEAGRTAFANKGLTGTNLKEDILRPAGVSVGSFYHQFKDKTELLLVILQEHADTFRKRLSEAHSPAPDLAVDEIARASYGLVFDLADESIEVMRIQMRERDSGDARVRAFLSEDRDRWIASLAADYARLAEGTSLKIDWQMAATLVVALSLSSLAHYHEVTADLAPEARAEARRELVEALVRFTLGGIPGLAGPAPP